MNKKWIEFVEKNTWKEWDSDDRVFRSHDEYGTPVETASAEDLIGHQIAFINQIKIDTMFSYDVEIFDALGTHTTFQSAHEFVWKKTMEAMK